MEGLRRSRVPSVTVCLLALSLAACTPEAPGSGSSPSETASTGTARDLAPSTDTSTAETLSGLTPPAEAPIVVGSGTAEGWEWVLSASADGACVALTDAQGSEFSCETGRSDLESEVLVGGEVPRNDVITVALRSPRPPAPPLVLLFGRVPPRTVEVDAHTRMLEPTDGRLFPAPGGVDLNANYYLEWISGYPYPFVPKVTVFGYDDRGRFVGASPTGAVGVKLERPDRALEPTFSTLTSITSGHSEVGTTGRDWEIGVFRNEATGLLCFGEVGGVSVCGPQEDPVPAWEDGIAQLCTRFGGPCAWPPLDVIGGEGGGNPDGVASFGWGVFRDPVVTVRAERFILPDGFGSLSERDRWLESEVFELPPEYGSPFRIFVWQCDDCLSGQTVGFDANAEEIARE